MWLLPTWLLPTDTAAMTLARALCCRLVNFKVAAVALARGPLTQDLSPVQFAIVLLAPITPQLGEALLTNENSTAECARILRVIAVSIVRHIEKGSVSSHF